MGLDGIKARCFWVLGGAGMEYGRMDDRYLQLQRWRNVISVRESRRGLVESIPSVCGMTIRLVFGWNDNDCSSRVVWLDMRLENRVGVHICLQELEPYAQVFFAR